MVALPFGALAADLPKRVAAPAPAPMMVAAHNWTGFYVGVGVGGRFGGVDFDHYENNPSYLPSGTTRESFATRSSGFAYGAHVGFNYQVNKLVFGVEGAWSGGNINDSARTTLGNVTGSFVRDREAEIGDLWSIGARVGVTTGSALFYAKGGYANTAIRFANIVVNDAATGTSIPAGTVLSSSRDRVGGYFLGAGIEFMLTQNIIAGVDYTFARFDMGRTPGVLSSGAVSSCCGNDRIDVDLHTVMARLSYKFGGSAAPVVARY